MFNLGKCTRLCFLLVILVAVLVSCVGTGKLTESKAQSLATAYLKPFKAMSFAQGRIDDHPVNYPGYRYHCNLTVRDNSGEEYTLPIDFYYQYDGNRKMFLIDKTAGSLVELYRQQAQRHHPKSNPHSTLKHVQSWEMH